MSLNLKENSIITPSTKTKGSLKDSCLKRVLFHKSSRKRRKNQKGQLNMMNSPVSYMGNDPIRDQLREWAVRGWVASLQMSEDEETNDGSKPFDIALEPILI